MLYRVPAKGENLIISTGKMFYVSGVNVIAVVSIAMGHDRCFSKNCPSVGNIICRIMKIFEKLEKQKKTKGHLLVRRKWAIGYS